MHRGSSLRYARFVAFLFIQRALLFFHGNMIFWVSYSFCSDYNSVRSPVVFFFFYLFFFFSSYSRWMTISRASRAEKFPSFKLNHRQMWQYTLNAVQFVSIYDFAIFEKDPKKITMKKKKRKKNLLKGRKEWERSERPSQLCRWSRFEYGKLRTCLTARNDAGGYRRRKAEALRPLARAFAVSRRRTARTGEDKVQLRRHFDILLCFSRVKDVKNPRRMSSSSVPCQADQLLIEQVRSHKVLYAVATKSNRDNQLRDRAWMEIARTLERSGNLHSDSFVHSYPPKANLVIVLVEQSNYCLGCSLIPGKIH